MWGNSKSAFSVSGATTLISRDTTITGDVQFCGNLDVEGVVKGNIYADPDAEALVRVVDKGRVEGEIQVPHVIVNGTVQGSVRSTKRIELAARGRVEGDVFYTLLEMAAGSEVNGSLRHIVDSESPQLDRQTAVSAKGVGAGSDQASGGT